MLKLLKTEDIEVLGKSNFAKNAVFYKDLMAFCEAYRQILLFEDDLPGFCYNETGDLCLEGLCLFMKMYATELKFETLKLTLDYLKILYFAMASYSNEEGLVDTGRIYDEFHEYRRAGEKFCEEQKESLETKQIHAKEFGIKLKDDTKKIGTLKKRAKICNVFSIILFILSTLNIFLPIIVYINLSLSSPLFAISVACVVVGFGLAIGLKVCSKKSLNYLSDLSFHVQTMKKKFNEESLELAQYQSKYYKIFCEKGEYAFCFSELMSKFNGALDFAEIVKKAKSYKLLSYNIAYDIGRLFKSQQKEIDQIIDDIENISPSSDFKKELSEIYSGITQQDWMYFNAEVRYRFLNKFIEFAEKNYDWKIDFENGRVNPFGVNVKDMVREEIAFVTSKDKKPIIMKLADFTKTKYFKDLDELSFKDGYSVDSLKRVKANYLSKFYNPVYVEEFMKSDEIECFEKIPTLVNLKLKLIEANNGLGNSDAKVIKDISQVIFVEEKQFEQEDFILKESDIEYPKFTAQSVEEVDDAVVFDFGGTKKIGYKVK